MNVIPYRSIMFQNEYIGMQVALGIDASNDCLQACGSAASYD